MQQKKIIAVLLCVLLLAALIPPVSSAGVNGYYNVNYLESFADAAYDTQGLGAVWSQDSTTWKVWSPVATHVQLRLYATGSDEEAGAKVLGTHSMTKDAETGLWSITLQGDYKNVYYTYLVTARGKTNETRDIYAKAAGVNGYRSMVVDLDATDPEGWDSDRHVLPDESTDAVIWEVHVRDFSISPTSGVSEANQGKFLAFTEEDTTLNGNPGEVSTCVNYLKEMGVNTVHLLPVYDFGSVDETVNNDPANRNWGYDPINYNVPEGSYSTDPYNGNTRITEFKQMVQALHRAGISVVMDVVYNHTFDIDTHQYGHPLLYNNAFNETVPGYYFRMSGPSSWYDGSGCGNVTASDKLMYRKYMIESVHYWATEYHIDGFRFDLMGCHDVDTMNAIRADLDQLDGGEGQKILMYGEPWTGGDAGIANGCTQDGAKTYHLNERVGLFCDWMRDAIKGDPDGYTKGWIQGNSTKAGAVLNGLSAHDDRLSARSQSVTYADAHDNLILWDKILNSNGSAAWNTYSGPDAQRYLKQLNLAKTIVLMSQGMVFNVAGTEFARSKQGNHNSYNADDSVNAIDWTVRKTNQDYAEYYKGLIQIREHFSPITDPETEYNKYFLEGSSDSCIAFRIPNETEGEWSNLILLLNNAGAPATVTLPDGNWTLLADGNRAGLTALSSCSGSYTVPTYGSAILVNDTPIAPPGPDTDENYYLVGWINGGNYGCDENAFYKGIYKFEDGSLTATFDQDSYVYVKTGNNARWYMTDGWLGTRVTSATLYNTDDLDGTGDKLYVPAGYEVHFTLTENSDGTLELSYTAEGYDPGSQPEPADPGYYLIGYINGADYGDKEDWQNLGDYRFEDGSLTTTFTQDSYVYVKTADNANWYMTKGWLGFDVTSATLYNTASISNGNKFFVPGGVKVTFTLTDNGNDTLTLSYTLDTRNQRPAEAEPDYYLFGSINGADYGTGKDWENLGDYRFVNGTLTTSFAAESYVAVKTGDNAHWYMTDGWQGDATAATLYDTSVYTLGENANKLKVPGNVELTFTLTENEDNTVTLSYAIGDPILPPAGEAKDAVILHCWNWSYDTIRAHLAEIKAAGYTAVQTSPAQVPKAFDNSTAVDQNWWQLYQPTSFCIAPNASLSPLGGKAELQNLCDAAEELGLEVIVDVVANHLGNGYDDLLAAGQDPEAPVSGGGKLFNITPSALVNTFEPTLYNNGDFTRYFRDYLECTDATTEGVVRGNIGMPDLKTEDPYVQARVAAYLQELIDVGVDGFRFDAIKHIETPSDGEYASDFWPNVLGAARTHAQEKGVDLWAYGEIYQTTGNTRHASYYTPYMDFTDLNGSGTITWGLNQRHSATELANLRFTDYGGTDPVAAESLVLFGETHDWYADGTTSGFSVSEINRAWAVDCAKAGVSTLYFARPASITSTKMGVSDTNDWKRPEVVAANKFHTAFVGAAEDSHASGDFVIIERYSENQTGAVIVNVAGYSSSLSLPVNRLADGTYYDQVTNNVFTVSDGTLTGEMGATGVVVLQSEAADLCEHAHTHEVNHPATCTEAGYVEVICDDCGLVISRTETEPALGHVDEDGDSRCDLCGEFLGTLTVYFVDGLDWVPENDYFSLINHYAFGDGGQNAAWPGLESEIVGYTTDEHGIWKVELNPEAFGFVKFVGHPGQTGEVKTVNLPFVTDAGDNSFIIYTCTDTTETDEYGGQEYTCTAAFDLEAVCGHTAYTVITENDGSTRTVCDCCGKVLETTDPIIPFRFEDVQDENKFYYDAVYWAVEHGITNGTDATHFKPGNTCTRGQVVTFLWRAYGSPAPTVTEKPFTDVKDNAYYADAVLWALEKGITKGKTETTFVPNGQCTRAEVVTFLWRAAGSPQPETEASHFEDVTDGYYKDAVLWAVEKGITNGADATHFNPKSVCTRGHVVTFLYRAFQEQ